MAKTAKRIVSSNVSAGGTTPGRVPAGIGMYKIGSEPCVGTGVRWTATDLDTALADSVVGVLRDETGSAIVREILGHLGETKFATDQIAERVTSQSPSPSWRVGEAIAEVYLTDWRNCLFPWPMSRDARRSGASLPGADLVGLTTGKTGERFVFGEIKTSSQATYPPGVMYGSSGLRQQLEDLQDSVSIREVLVRYLAVRSEHAPWRDRFLGAVSHYLADRSDVRLYGVLIRDVPPDSLDLHASVSSLANNCSGTMQVELLSIYLPQGRIDRLPKDVMPISLGGRQ